MSPESTREHRLWWLSAAIALLGAPLAAIAGGGKVYESPRDIPRAIGVPKYPALASAPGSVNAVSVKALLLEEPLGEKKTEGRAAFHGVLKTVRKFVRLEVSSITSLAIPAKVEVIYTVTEGGVSRTESDSVIVNGERLNFTMDFAGVKDEFGKEVTDTTEFASKDGRLAIQTTSFLAEYPEAQIVGIEVRVCDGDGAPLYIGAWPKPAEEVVTLPQRLTPRVFTDHGGRTLRGVVLFLGTKTVTIRVDGRDVDVPLTSLSAPDLEFLDELRKELDAIGKKPAQPPGG